MTDVLPTMEVPPAGDARAAVIWLHGLGADGHDFAAIVPELAMPPELGVRFVFPHAPSIPVTLNGGMVMPAWYDIAEIDLQRRHDEVGVRRSDDHVRALIDREQARGIPASRIVLAGFSQGGAVALFSALRHPERLAGVIALSTYLLLEDALDAERAAANQDVPILQVHGSMDPMVPCSRGEAARDALLRRGYSVDFRTYPMEHAVCLEEIQVIREFLVAALS
ncbi:MAG: dienelactone hydrolase family protein [Planctomycetota bacterium]|nr:dienelactone hydrolase family protein [Planctomycetota bacterium]MEC8251765.1 dienelactone hydrolase family protein [Planctomycetota bacterium]MEC9049046.1 dienelactone hydrolase family protein [Planctomycetota bacterium]